MPRSLRFQYPGAVWHAMNRGVEKRDIYLDERDRLRFLRLVRDAVGEFGWRLFAYVLMTNHYHLLFCTPETNLSLGMKAIDEEYASGFNQRYGRVGHLFGARFRAHLVDSEQYLLELSRYLVLNPIRAGMVGRPEDWIWSS